MGSYRAPEFSIIPTLFIGMGGTGSRIVDRIASRAAALPHWDAQLRGLTEFVVVDTNTGDQNQLSTNIPLKNRINLSAFDKSQAVENWRTSNNQQALQWLPPGYEPRKGIKPGAGQIRMESRLGFFFNSPEIRETLKKIVESMLGGETSQWRDPTKFQVHLFTTLAGGTGSGSSLSMAYLVNSIIEEKARHPRIIGHLLLSTLLTRHVQTNLHNNIHANTYAALKEIEHMTKLDYGQVRAMGRNSEAFPFAYDKRQSEPSVVSKRPFFMSFVYDDPGIKNVPDFEAAISDATFLQLFSPIMADLESELDNYEQHMGSLSTLPGRTLGLGFTKQFGCVGAAVLDFPAAPFLEYCTLRFAAQAVRQQITFGIDRTSAQGDERVRRLEQYAVDYGDQKFLNLPAEQRSRIINRAFVQRVQELGAMDLEDDQPLAYWAQVIERVDLGAAVAGAGQVKENEERKRNPSIIDQVNRLFDEDRENLFTKIQVDSPGFVFFRENLSQYDNLVDKLQAQYRAATAMVADHEQSVVTKAASGIYIDKLALDPISERYLVLRLLEQVEANWMPAAEADVTRRQQKSLAAPKVIERLGEIKSQLLDAAGARRFGILDDNEFLAVREQSSTDFRGIAQASREFLKAQVRQRQIIAFWKYLVKRAETFAQLSTRMDSLVNELEKDADRLQKGEGWKAPPYALHVEALQRLEGATGSGTRDRLWGAAWNALFIADGRYLVTFDRVELSAAIREQLKPAVDAGGRVRPKTTTEIERDIRSSLLRLADTKLRPEVYGDEGLGTSGLTLTDAINLEAKLVLPGDDDQMAAARRDYFRKKIRAVGALSGPIGRVNTDMVQTSGDEVVASLRRSVVIGASRCITNSNPTLREAMQLELGQTAGRRQLGVKDGGIGAYDQHVAIVHDAEMGLPLYYWPAVTGEIQPPYIALQSNPRRQFLLHTSVEWEKGLPNLDPQDATEAVDWTLNVVRRAILVGLISTPSAPRGWELNLPKLESIPLGASLTVALYKLEQLYASESTERLIVDALATAEAQVPPSDVEEVRLKLIEAITHHLAQLEVERITESKSFTQAEYQRKLLDKPALLALQRALEAATPTPPKPARTTSFTF